MIIVYLPIMTFGIYNIRKFRHTVVMQKRHYGLSIAIAIGYIIQSLLISIIIISYGGYMKFSTVGWGFCVLMAITAVIVNYMQLIKMWIHYFDVKFNCKELSRSWRSVINPETIDTNHNNWFFKHHQTYGNPNYFLKRLIIAGFIVFVILITHRIVTGFQQKNNTDTESVQEDNIMTTVSTAISMICGGFPIIITLFIGCRIPSFHDSFYIKKEAKYLMIMVLVANIIIIIQVGGLYIYPTVGVRQVSVLTFWLLMATSSFGLSVLVTLWAVRRNSSALEIITRKSMFKSPYRLRLELEIVNSNSPTSESTDKNKSKEESIGKSRYTLRLETLIKCKYGFELLMNHLSHEFSMELILSLIEMVQFKKQYMIM